MIERLKEIRLKFNKTQNEMAEIIGISRSTYTGIEKGKATLTERNKMLIIDKLNINPIWFETGKGEMLKSNFTQSDVRNVDTQTMNWIQIPFIPVHARATFAETFETEIHELSSITIPRLPGINYENGKVFEVDGDSMDPTLITGEQVFCEYVDPADWKYITGPVVIAFGNNMIVVKRIKENNLANGELTLWSDNEMGGKLTLHTEQDQIRRMYKVRYTVYKPIR
jgi:putative phage repressor